MESSILRFGCVGSFLLLLLLLHSSSVALAQNPQVNLQQRATISELNTKLKQASRYYRAQKNSEAADLIRDIESTLGPLTTSKDPAVVRTAIALTSSVNQSKKLLETRGITFKKGTAAQAADAMAVSFTKQIAPVLVEHCVGCHGNGGSRAGLNLQSFEGIQRGGNSGTLRVPAQMASMSLLVGKLRGTADGEQMPLGEDPLPEATIKLFEAWLNNGAPFDGETPTDDLESVITAARVKELSHAELAELRIAKSASNWKLGMPGIAMNSVSQKRTTLDWSPI